MNMCKRIVSLMMVLCLLLPLAAFAEDDEELTIVDVVLTEEDFEREDFDWESFVSDDEAGEVLEEVDPAEVDTSINPDDLELNPNLPDNVINILLVGVDMHEKDIRSDTNLLHGDVNMVLSVNTDDGSIKLTSFLRDLYVEIPGYKSKAKLNAAYARGGGQLAMRTINHNFGLNVQDYVTINFYGVASIVDALGGIDIDMTKTEARAINAYLAAAYKKKSKFTYDTLEDSSQREPLDRDGGTLHCDGIQALMYARLRKIDSDFARTARQRHLLELLLNKVLQDMDVNKLLNLITITLPYVITSMNAQTMFNLATTVLKTDIITRAREGGELFGQFRIPMDKTYGYDTVNGSSVVTMSSKNFASNVEALHYFIYGAYYPAE